MMRVASLLLGLGLFALGCDNNPGMPDAPLADAPALEPSYLFGPCVADAQCEHLGEGAICREAETGPTEGYCTVPCDDRTPCDAFMRYHHCLTLAGETQSYCVPQCRNGADCIRDSWTCDPNAGPTEGNGVCLSVCQTDAECGGGAVCNPESSRCEAPPVDTAGAAHGEPCGEPSDCASGYCINEGTRTQPTGWVGGMCVGVCRVPDGFNTTTFFDGEALPRGGCVEGAVCIPGAQIAEGDLGTCYRECSSMADCRPGYGCLQTLGRGTFSNRICVPLDCGGGGCPTGYQCVTVNLSDGSTANRCAPL